MLVASAADHRSGAGFPETDRGALRFPPSGTGHSDHAVDGFGRGAPQRGHEPGDLFRPTQGDWTGLGSRAAGGPRQGDPRQARQGKPGELMKCARSRVCGNELFSVPANTASVGRSASKARIAGSRGGSVQPIFGKFWTSNPRGRMSACGYKRTFTHTVIYVRFTPESGHSHGSRKRSAFDPERTLGTSSARNLICQRDV